MVVILSHSNDKVCIFVAVQENDLFVRWSVHYCWFVLSPALVCVCPIVKALTQLHLPLISAVTFIP